MAFGETYVYFTVFRSNGGSSHVCQIDTAQLANIIEDRILLVCRYDASNCPFHLTERQRCIFKARSGWSAHVQTECSGIYIWEKVLPDEWDERQGHHAQKQACNNDHYFWDGADSIQG